MDLRPIPQKFHGELIRQRIRRTCSRAEFHQRCIGGHTIVPNAIPVHIQIVYSQLQSCLANLTDLLDSRIVCRVLASVPPEDLPPRKYRFLVLPGR